MLKRLSDLKNAVEDIANDQRFISTANFCSGVFKEAEAFVLKPNYWNAARVVVGVAKYFSEDFQLWSEGYFTKEGSEWKPAWEGGFKSVVHDILGAAADTTIKTSEPNTYIKVYDISSTTRIGFAFDKRANRFETAVYVAGDPEEANVFLAARLWQRFEGSAILLRSVEDRDRKALSFTQDTSTLPLPSKRAHEYAQYLQKCINAGVHRSVMMYGPAGSGKSTMARAIIDELGMRSLRIRVEDMAAFDNEAIVQSLVLIKPDAIILDDFDRSHDQSKLLETLEHFQKHVKLVIATVNNRNDLDEALLRPGRFDEMMLVDTIEEHIIKHILGDDAADMFETVKGWPVAFIQELRKRRLFLSHEEAAATMEELISRVARLRARTDGEDDDVEGKFLATHGKKSGKRDTKRPLSVAGR